MQIYDMTYKIRVPKQHFFVGPYQSYNLFLMDNLLVIVKSCLQNILRHYNQIMVQLKLAWSRTIYSFFMIFFGKLVKSH